MATVLEHPDKQVHSQPAEILSDDAIEALLQEAETRLRQKSVALAKSSSDGSFPKHKPIPKLQHGLDQSFHMSQRGGVAKANPEIAITSEQKRLAEELRPVNSTAQSKKVNDQTDAGPAWFNLPKTELTPQLKRDLQLIEMRNVLDPHRHYKKNNRKGKVPTFSQVGTVIEGPTEFFSGRINRKDRSKNFVEEAMKGELENGRFKRKYAEIQDKKTSGKKAHYKKLMARRKKL